MSILLTQAEADALIAMPKHSVDDKTLQFPIPGGRLVFPLISIDRSEDFLMDVTRSRIDFAKVTYQSRGRAVVVLLRLDLNGPPHRNPDGLSIPCPHLHIYREGYGDKWASAVPSDRFSKLDDLAQTLSDFMTECNVLGQPSVQAGLF